MINDYYGKNDLNIEKKIRQKNEAKQTNSKLD